MRLLILVLLTGGILVMTSCQNEVIYEKNLPVNCDGWNLGDSLVFEVKIEDVHQKYDLSINVRHRDVYEFMNLYVNIITRLPNNSIKKEIIMLPLCDDGGKWYGNCSGDVCFQRIYLMKRVVFPVPGIYTFRINQEMRTENLRNLFDLGLRLEKSIKRK